MPDRSRGKRGMHDLQNFNSSNLTNMSRTGLVRNRRGLRRGSGAGAPERGAIRLRSEGFRATGRRRAAGFEEIEQ